MNKAVNLLIGTRKGAFFLHSDQSRKSWELSDPIYLGHIIQHFVSDPRDPNKMVMGAKAGHLGPTVYHSADAGKTWQESSKPPQFPKAEGDEAEGKKAKTVESVFWITPGHASEAGTWYAGTAPAGLFVSHDDGDTWEPVPGFNEHPQHASWTEQGATPAGLILHSINIDPRDKNHMYIGISVGGVFESKDKGLDWSPLNKGCASDFIPTEEPEYGHDPHCLVQHPANPDRLYQQNHCGIYRIDRPSDRWVRIGNNMPKEVGDIGFPIVLDPRDDKRAWVFPMDGSDVWPRTSPGGKPAVYYTADAGESWQRQDAGLPKSKAFFTVKRQAMCGDGQESLGLYFGTSQGEIWASTDEGKTWNCIVQYLPEIYSITAC